MTSRVGHLVIGPETHGVVRYAKAVHEAQAALGDHRDIAEVATADCVPPALMTCSLIHMHVTDRLFGDTAADALERLRRLVGTYSGRVSLTLHDIPQPSDGRSMPNRVHFYRGAIELADGVIVSSEHEKKLLHNFVDDAATVEVVPLMIESPRSSGFEPRTTAETVGVLGFLYPGKGHIETLRAMSDLPSTVSFVALGTASPGHEDLVDELRAAADAQRRGFEITGFLDDEELHRRMSGITVPVAYHRHMSASGSINTWISARRRPLVPRTDYSVELARRTPGSVAVHDDGDVALRDAIAKGIANPLDSWIEDGVRPVPSPDDVATAYGQLYRQWCS